MRTEAELRAALATLERACAHMPLGSGAESVLAGEIAAIRWVLGEEVLAGNTLEETLPQMRAMFEELDTTDDPVIVQFRRGLHDAARAAGLSVSGCDEAS